jgi:hypothetical protein
MATMPNLGELPTVFAQKLPRNERIASLLSSVLFRGINPSFSHAIRRHPLSLWSLHHSTALDQTSPVAVFLESKDSSDCLLMIAKVLKKSIAESGFLVAELKDDAIERLVFLIFLPCDTRICAVRWLGLTCRALPEKASYPSFLPARMYI